MLGVVQRDSRVCKTTHSVVILIGYYGNLNVFRNLSTKVQDNSGLFALSTSFDKISVIIQENKNTYLYNGRTLVNFVTVGK